MSEMIERVARTLFAELGWEGVSAHPAFEHDQELWLKAARAAIEAMREPTKSKTDVPAQGTVEWREALDDLVSHREAWRVAIVRTMGNSPPAAVDDDDKLYWHHELRVFDRVFTALASQPPAAPVETLKHLVDWTYLHASEGEVWPSSKTADELIHAASERAPKQADADFMKRKAFMKDSRSSAGSAQATIDEMLQAARLHLLSNRTLDADRAIVRAQEALIRVSPQTLWQLIDTAPKDGKRILLYQEGRGAFEGWWHTDWPHAEAYWMDDADSEPSPTHWQPTLALPRPHGRSDGQ